MSVKKISIEDFKTAIATDYCEYTDATWRGLDIHIRTCLSLEEMMTFVHDVVSSCFAENTGEYLPEIKDFATRCSILESYAGFELPKRVSEKYELVYGTDIISFIVQYVEQAQFNNMLASIDKKIDHLAQSNIEALNQQMGEVVTRFEALEENLSGVFTGIDNESIAKIAGAIADGSFDENKLVKAFTQNADNSGKVMQMPTKDK